VYEQCNKSIIMKFTLEQARKTQRRNRGIALLYSLNYAQERG